MILVPVLGGYPYYAQNGMDHSRRRHLYLVSPLLR